MKIEYTYLYSILILICRVLTYPMLYCSKVSQMYDEKFYTTLDPSEYNFVAVLLFLKPSLETNLNPQSLYC